VTTGPITTKSGRVLSEADIDGLAKRAEEGFDLSTWKPRRGRPWLGDATGGHSPRIEARVPEALHRRVTTRAAREGKSLSAVVRALLEDYASDVS
jgi:hypothetical protein